MIPAGMGQRAADVVTVIALLEMQDGAGVKSGVFGMAPFESPQEILGRLSQLQKLQRMRVRL